MSISSEIRRFRVDTARAHPDLREQVRRVVREGLDPLGRDDQAIDFREPYLRTLLRFIGLTDVTFIYAEKLGLGPQAREVALAAAKTKIAAVARQSPAEAA